jgi:hypothetical protein
MCKLIAISGLSLKNTAQASQLVAKSAELLGLSQKDGFGYALNHQGGVYSERFLSPDSVKGMGTMKASRELLPSMLKTKIKQGVDFDSYGEFPSKGSIKGSFIAHGRTATCDKVIGNTHPFRGNIDDKDWWIAHNGVVAWKGENLPLQTTCDSEHLLNCFMYLKGEQSFKDNISGYAAIVGFNPNRELFVLRDNKAPLYITYIKALGTFIVCTDSTHCVKLADLINGFYNLKNAVYTEPLMLEEWCMHTFLHDGEITSTIFPEFSATSPYISQASMYSSLGSAGAAGYTAQYQSRAWDDYDYDYYSKEASKAKETPKQGQLPLSVPSAESIAYETHKREMAENYKRNSKKKVRPYKDKGVNPY